MQQFCNSCDEYRDIVIESDCWSCVWDKAEAATEERIIKLLEGKKASEIIYTTHPIEADCDVIYRLILLIKGEK